MFRFLIIASLLGVALSLSVPVAAQETPPPTPIINVEASIEPEVTLDELLQRALQNNPQLPIARQNLEAARQRVGANRVLDNPVLQVVPGLTGTREARDEEIILSQPLDLFGQRRARRGAFEAEARRNTVTGSAGSTALHAVFTILIFDFGSNKRERRALEAESHAQEAQVALLHGVQSEYLQALVGVRANEAALESALGATLPASLTGTLGNLSGAAPPPNVAAPGTITENTIPRLECPPLNPSTSDSPSTDATTSTEGGRLTYEP